MDTCLHDDELECDGHVSEVPRREVKQEGSVPACGAPGGDDHAFMVQVHHHLVTCSNYGDG